jgi:hypothetical protein
VLFQLLYALTMASGVNRLIFRLPRSAVDNRLGWWCEGQGGVMVNGRACNLV